MTTSEMAHAVKPYDTVIIIDSNFDIKELRETLKAQDVYDDEKGKVYNQTTMNNISFSILFAVEHISASAKNLQSCN